jgi:D-aminoacyl-tRNA deacylase
LGVRGLMKTVIQRVSNASVTIENKIVAQIQKGLLVLVGIENADGQEDIDWLVSKIVNIRIFASPTPALPEGEGVKNGVMNLSVKDVDGEIIVVSQFTLHALTKKGNRPSYIKASKPEIAIPIYENFVQKLRFEFGKPIQTGVFGADMQVSLLNDGPVTIVMDSKNRE